LFSLKKRLIVISRRNWEPAIIKLTFSIGNLLLLFLLLLFSSAIKSILNHLCFKLHAWVFCIISILGIFNVSVINYFCCFLLLFRTGMTIYSVYGIHLLEVLRLLFKLNISSHQLLLFCLKLYSLKCLTVRIFFSLRSLLLRI